MAAAASKTPAAEKNAALREEIAGTTERVRSLAEAENVEGVAELVAETQALIAQLPKREQAKLTAALTEAGQAQPKVEEKPKAEVAVKAEPVDIMTIEGVPDLLTLGAEKVRDIAAAKFRGGKDVATVIFDIRRRIINPATGLPDIMADLQESKDAFTKVFDMVTENLPEVGEHGPSDEIRSEVNSLKKAAKNGFRDVTVEYILGLDNTPEEAEKWASIAEGKEGKTSEIVAAHLDFALKTRAEIARDDRAKKKLEIAAKVEAGEISEEDADAALDAKDEKELTPSETAIKALRGANRALKPLSSDLLGDIEDEKEREKIVAAAKAARDLLNALLGAAV